jgi:DNA repair photolyase
MRTANLHRDANSKLHEVRNADVSLIKSCFEEGCNLKPIEAKRQLDETPVPNGGFRKLDTKYEGGVGVFDRPMVLRLIAMRMPVHWGVLSDGFQPIEAKRRVSWHIAGILNHYDYPVAIDTKGILPMRSDYFKKLTRLKTLAMQTSFCHGRPSVVHAIERGAGGIKDRLKMLKMYKDAGYFTQIRFQPYIPFLPDCNKWLKRLIDRSVDCVDWFSIEFFRWAYQRPISLAFKKMGINIEREFRRMGATSHAESKSFEFPAEVKKPLIMEIVDHVHKYGLGIGVKDNSHFMICGDGKSCCGLEQVDGFQGTYRKNYNYACYLLKRKGTVSLADLKDLRGLGSRLDKKFIRNWKYSNRLDKMCGVRHDEDGNYYLDKRTNRYDEKPRKLAEFEPQEDTGR